MKLYYSSTSPFVRKVTVFAIEAGLGDQLERITTNPWQAEDKLTTKNPLSQIPTLITDDKRIIYDSRIICEYLDSLNKVGKFIPDEGEARWLVLCLQALADGMLDAGILRLMEHKRATERQSNDWDLMQKNTVERGLDYLQNTVADWGTNSLNIGIITVACTLGWLEFRFKKEDWRINRPELTAWFDVFSNRTSMRETLPRE